MRSFFTRLFIFLGICCFLILFYLLWERYYPKNLSFSSITVQSSSVSQKHKPILLSIPSIQIRLPVIPAKVRNGQWETTTEGISYVINSPEPGAEGNSIFYGHNFPNILGSLPKVKPGEKVSITFDDDSTKTFFIQYTSVVSPNQIDILKPSSDKRITIYTCTGWFDRKRFVVVATLL